MRYCLLLMKNESIVLSGIKLALLFLAFAFVQVGKSAGNCIAGDLHVYYWTQPENRGDRNQVLGLIHSIREVYSEGRVQEIEFSSSRFSLRQFKNKVKEQVSRKALKSSNTDSFLFLGAGTGGVNALQKVADIPALKLVYLSHQLTPQAMSVLGKADLWIVPEHAVNSEFLKEAAQTRTQVIQTIGGLHNLKQHDLKVSFQQHQKDFPPTHKYVGIVLGGDAQLPNGKVQYFTSAEARKLAAWIAKRPQSKNSMILVVNSPRTGRYNLETGRPYLRSHRDGKPDLVTQSFMAELCMHIPANRVQLFDFQYNKPSAYKALLGAIQRYSGELYVPGDSTSMVSEATEMLPGRVTVYEDGAMSEVHHAHIKSEFESGRIHHLTADLEFRSRKAGVLFPLAYGPNQAARNAILGILAKPTDKMKRLR